jgi:hypothetical protein
MEFYRNYIPCLNKGELKMDCHRGEKLKYLMMKKLLFTLLIFTGIFGFLPGNKAIAQPQITVYADELNFGDLPYGFEYVATVYIFNEGNDVLQINDISFSNADFSASSTSLTVASFEFQSFTVMFSPSNVGVFEEQMQIFSNDPVTPVFTSQIYANISLLSPPYLSALVINNTDVQLSWGSSGGGGNWLSYDTEFVGSSAGLATPGVYRIAARWPANSLTDYAGAAISRMLYFPISSTIAYTLKVWKGMNAEIVVHTQSVSPVQLNEYNEVILSSPVIIEPGEDYWFGIEIQQLLEYDFGAAFDSGPAVVGFGDMINIGGGWESFYNYGFNNNWLIRAFVQETNGSISPENAPVVYEKELKRHSTLVANQDRNPTTLFNKSQPINQLGYNLYRDGSLLNTEPLNTAIYTDFNLSHGIYQYAVTAVYDVGESGPVEKTVQIGGPSLSINPQFIQDNLQTGQSQSYTVQKYNSGLAALEWSVADLPSWLSITPSSGIIQAGESATTSITISTNGLYNGFNNYTMVIQTNNAGNPQTNLTFLIAVEGNSALVWDEPVLDFGMTPLFQSKLLTAHLTNNANVPTYLYGFYTQMSAFVSYPQDWVVQPGQTTSINVWYTPDMIGVQNDTLTLSFFNAFESGDLKLALTGQGALSPPSSLSYTLEEELLNLQWFAPGASPVMLRYGSGDPYYSIYTVDSVSYEMMAKFGPSELMAYAGKQLEAVSFYLYDPNVEAKIRVYTGEQANTLLVELPVNNLQVNGWTDVLLPESIPVDEYTFLWIGYEILPLDFIAAAGIDNGPGVAGAGDLFRIDGSEWRSLSEYNINGNWTIRGLLGEAGVGDSTIKLNYSKSANQLLGYNVYKDGLKLTESPVATTNYVSSLAAGQTSEFGVTAVYNFGESNPAEIIVTAPGTLNMPEGWNFTPTPMAHNIHIPEFLQQIGMTLSPGDMIGAFYHDNGIEKCGGAALWTGEHIVLTIYGDNPATPAKDGFMPNENIHWKVYMHQQQVAGEITAEFSHDMPQYNGKFHMLGLSMIETIELGTVSLNEQDKQSIHLYPNPSNGSFAISGLNKGDEIKVYSASGKLVYISKAISNLEFIDISISGIYIVELYTLTGELKRNKIIIY